MTDRWGRVLAFGGLFLAAGLVAAIAAPHFIQPERRSKRAELPSNLDGVFTAELAYDAAFDEILACGSPTRARAIIAASPKAPRPWEGGDCWERLGWAPDGQVRGAYWVEVSADNRSFTVWAIGDTDGDGEIAIYLATDADGARPLTPNDVW